MKIKIRDLVNLKINSCNNQQSLDIRKNTLKKFGMDIDDILNTSLSKKIKRFEEGGE